MRNFLNPIRRRAQVVPFALAIVGANLSAGCGGGIGETKAFRHTAPVYDLAFIPGTNDFVSVQLKDGSTELWNTAESTPIMEIAADGISVDVTRNGDLVAIGTLSGDVILWDPANRVERQRWSIDNGSAISVAFAAQDTLLIVGQGPGWNGSWVVGFDESMTPQDSYYVNIYQIPSGKLLHSLTDLAEFPVTVGMSQLGTETMILSMVNETAIAKSLSSGEVVWSSGRQRKSRLVLREDAPRVAVAPDGRTFCWAGDIWDMQSMRPIARLQVSSKDAELLCSKYSLNSGALAGGTRGGQIYMWNATTGACDMTISASKNGSPITALDLSADGQYILTGTMGSIGGFDAIAHNKSAKDPYIRLWKVEDLLKGAAKN